MHRGHGGAGERCAAGQAHWPAGITQPVQQRERSAATIEQGWCAGGGVQWPPIARPALRPERRGAPVGTSGAAGQTTGVPRREDELRQGGAGRARRGRGRVGGGGWARGGSLIRRVERSPQNLAIRSPHGKGRFIN